MDFGLSSGTERNLLVSLTDASDSKRMYSVDDTLTLMPDTTTATDFLNTLNHAHPSVSFTMEIEKDGMLPFLGTHLLNRAHRIETKVYVKPTYTGLLVHYQSHVDNRYKCSIARTVCPLHGLTFGGV